MDKDSEVYRGKRGWRRTSVAQGSSLATYPAYSKHTIDQSSGSWRGGGVGRTRDAFLLRGWLFPCRLSGPRRRWLGLLASNDVTRY